MLKLKYGSKRFDAKKISLIVTSEDVSLYLSVRSLATCKTIFSLGRDKLVEKNSWARKKDKF